MLMHVEEGRVETKYTPTAAQTFTRLLYVVDIKAKWFFKL